MEDLDKNQQNPIIYSWIILLMEVMLRKFRELNNLLFRTLQVSSIFREEVMERRLKGKEEAKRILKEKIPDYLIITNIKIKD